MIIADNLSGLFTNKSSQYRDPDNRGLGFCFDYREHHPNNRGPTVSVCMVGIALDRLFNRIF